MKNHTGTFKAFACITLANIPSVKASLPDCTQHQWVPCVHSERGIVAER